MATVPSFKGISSPMAAGTSTMSGGRMCQSISKSFPNLSVDSVRSSSISYRLQASRRSSSEENDQKDFGDVRESGRKESMKEYVKKAEDQAAVASEKAKQKAGEAAGKAKETAGAAREKEAETTEKTRETAVAAKDKVKETAGEGTEKAAGKVAGTAESIGAKARQTVQGAWEAAKETTHKIKETVAGKDEDAAAGDVGRKHGREKL